MANLSEVEPKETKADEWVCPKCCASFPALFALNRHVREKHNEPKGLSR